MEDRRSSRVVANALHRAIDEAFPHKRSREYSGLLMLSGGLDSVALLVNILMETRQTLHAHHVEIQNFENRVQAENDAIRNILDHCRRNFREFTYTSSKSEFHLGLGGGLDITLVMFTAARVHMALGQVIDVVYTGDLRPSRSTVLESTAVFDACYTNRRFKPKWLRPLAKLKKIDIYESLPRELADMTWSCRKPVFTGKDYTACGTCHACKSRAEVSRALDERRTKTAG